MASDEVNWELIRLAMASIADIAIIPMQDILGLGKEARMNRPSIAQGNWEWQLVPFPTDRRPGSEAPHHDRDLRPGVMGSGEKLFA